MLGTQKQAIEAYQRVQDFLALHPPPETPGYIVQKKILDDVVTSLTDHSANQVVGLRLGRAEVPRQRELRRVLREEHLAPIAQIARTTLAEAPGIEKALRMPPYNLASMKLVAEAIAMRNAVEPYEKQFVEAGRPEGFLGQVDAAIEALRQSVLGKARHLGRQVGAGAGLQKDIRRGRRSVELMDAIVKAAFRGNQDVLAEWRVARRIRALPGAAQPASSSVDGAPVSSPVLALQSSQ